MRRATAILLAAVTTATPAVLVHVGSHRPPGRQDVSIISASDPRAERWHGDRPTTTETPTTLAPELPETVPEAPTPVSVAPRPTTPRTVPVAAPTGGAVLSVTAYCDSGTMANGQQTYAGAAAGNRWPFGTVLVVEGYGSVVIADRIGSGADVDLWMPSCLAANQWGRQARAVSVVG